MHVTTLNLIGGPKKFWYGTLPIQVVYNVCIWTEKGLEAEADLKLDLWILTPELLNCFLCLHKADCRP